MHIFVSFANGDAPTKTQKYAQNELRLRHNIYEALASFLKLRVKRGWTAKAGQFTFYNDEKGSI